MERENAIEDKTAVVITREELRQHWQGHRALTRRVIDAFPEDKLFQYSIGGMRPFSELTLELLRIATPGVNGVATGNWEEIKEVPKDVNLKPETKQEILRYWDWATDQIDRLWEQIPPNRFREFDTAFGLYDGDVWYLVFYFIDNEIHHRGQGYVYLRSLGIEPPAFYER